MCGIAGFVSSRFSATELQKMTQALAHRGPDADGYYYNAAQGVGLGHRRLSILDLSSAANQPFHSACGNYAMVFNGEIYNYKELSKELDQPLKTTSDTEVLLALFVEKGPSCVELLNGMFAFVVLDKRNGTLWAFRDRMGIKPFNYYTKGGEFAFASETKALLALNIDKALNLQALRDYFFLEYIPATSSIFRHIHKLPPGHWLKLAQGKLEITPYYNLQEKFTINDAITPSQAEDALIAQLSSSVAYRSLSDVPIGAFLSGGTDSSLICALFQSQNEQPIHSFNIAFETAQFDESSWAAKVASHLHTNHHSSTSRASDSLQLVEHLSDFYDEPFASASSIPTLQVCQHARQNVTVALSGDGGDELFMGYGYYTWYHRLKTVSRWGGIAGRKLATTLLNWGNLRQQRAARVFDTPSLERMWLHVWSQEQYMFSEKEISRLFGETYRHETLLMAWQELEKQPLTPFEKISLFDLQHYLPHNLLHKVDIASMAYGLEVRVPLLDHHLVEFALSLPQHYKIQQGQQKWLLKKALAHYLPHSLVYRRKWGFPAPLANWLATDLNGLCKAYLNPYVLQKQGVFNVSFIAKLLEDFSNGKLYHYKRIWSLLVFQMWYHRYISPVL